MATATVSGLTLIEDMETAPSISNIGGGPGASVTTDVIWHQTQEIGRRVNTTGAVRGFGVDLGASVDFTVAGRLLWVAWNAPLAPDGADTLANGGFRIRVSSTLGGASNYAEFDVGGGDVTEPGWNRTVLDVNGLTASRTSGTLDKTAVVNISLTYLYNTAPGGNIPHVVLGDLHYGSTIQVTGGTSGDRLTWPDVAAATEALGWGALRQPPGSSIFQANGDFQFGDDTGALDCYFEDKQRIIEWIDQRYYETTEKTAVPSTFQGITVANATGTCEFQDGTKIGTGDATTGADGSIFQTPPGSLTDLHFVATDADVGFVGLYGTQIRRATNAAQFSADATNGPNHELGGVTFDGCAQVDLGRVLTRGCAFQGHTGTDAALLWNANINIKRSAFRNNTDGTNNPAGIEHENTGSFTYDALTFAGNDNDVYNSSGGLVEIDIVGGGDTPTVRNGAGSSTTISNPKTITVTVEFTGASAPSDYEWRIYTNPGAGTLGTEVDGQEAETNLTFAYAYEYVSDTPATVQVIAPGFIERNVSVTLVNSDQPLAIEMALDESI